MSTTRNVTVVFEQESYVQTAVFESRQNRVGYNVFDPLRW